MAISYLTKTELDRFLHQNGNHIEASVRSALIDSLERSGVYSDHPGDTSKAAFQSGPFSGAVPTGVQILDIAQSTTVETTPNLKAIIFDDAGGKRLDVIGGHNDVFIAMGKGSDSVNLYDFGNDTVYGGSGNDAIRGGHGNSSLFGGGGNDSIYGGSGNDTLDGGSGNDYLEAGSGAQLLAGGSGNDILRDLSSGRSTLIGGDGNDTLIGVQGDVFEGGDGNDVFWVYGESGANSTLQGGNGNDTFHLQTHTGNDTIIGGAGSDTVDFADRSSFEVTKVDVDEKTKSYTLHFEGSQTVVVSGVEYLHFTDGDVQLPKL
ncbi:MULTISPECIES: calcium-binding protein [Bradyrhizobium]|uniref:Calcium-binding protein n=1 Tax=Bradyrhizobium frederickii TaxID=2560054 RepID=A0A4Y9KSC7_9BRAD|nr:MULTISPECIES: calcium-binding protein [Bradyrhizobium]RTE88013.1 calcium-binding protein [Bradyrhizobium sp. LVM 105]TFV29565.1 calcium-binding protein [Bradyrhizobium frederickii]TFV68019.1 calcium-binding protein [Bradyrhizobium frederickii]